MIWVATRRVSITRVPLVRHIIGSGANRLDLCAQAFTVHTDQLVCCQGAILRVFRCSTRRCEQGFLSGAATRPFGQKAKSEADDRQQPLRGTSSALTAGEHDACWSADALATNRKRQSMGSDCTTPCYRPARSAGILRPSDTR